MSLLRLGIYLINTIVIINVSTIQRKLLTGVSVKNFHQYVLSNIFLPVYFHNLVTQWMSTEHPHLPRCSAQSTAPGTGTTKALSSGSFFPGRAVNTGQWQSPEVWQTLPHSLSSFVLRLLSSRSQTNYVAVASLPTEEKAAGEQRLVRNNPDARHFWDCSSRM